MASAPPPLPTRYLPLPEGTPRDGDNFTRCRNPSRFCVHRVSPPPPSQPALTSAFVPEDHCWDLWWDARQRGGNAPGAAGGGQIGRMWTAWYMYYRERRGKKMRKTNVPCAQWFCFLWQCAEDESKAGLCSVVWWSGHFCTSSKTTLLY